MSYFGINAAQADWIKEAPSVAELLNNVLKYVLSIAGVLAILAIVFSGFLYITAAGDNEKAQKAKTGLMYSVGGLVVVLIAYTIVATVAGIIGQ